MKALAVKYRPNDWNNVVEQGSVTTILQNQLKDKSFVGAYCFVGAAGTGKTTCARIFANAINNGKGETIEIDAASNNGVDDVREIAKVAQTRSLTSEYKVFIIDECHLFSAGAWAAMLKLIEEPPAKSVFILCTTDYWKIPKTIQSRCQRYEFKRISSSGISNRLLDILSLEGYNRQDIDDSAIDFIAKQADGCLRDAITMLDKVLAYSETLNIETVEEALGLIPTTTYMNLLEAYRAVKIQPILQIIDDVYANGVDLKQFVKQLTDFTVEVCKYCLTKDISHTSLPNTDKMQKFLCNLCEDNDSEEHEWATETLLGLLDKLIEINRDMKNTGMLKPYIEAQFITMLGA